VQGLAVLEGEQRGDRPRVEAQPGDPQDPPRRRPGGDGLVEPAQSGVLGDRRAVRPLPALAFQDQDVAQRDRLTGDREGQAATLAQAPPAPPEIGDRPPRAIRFPRLGVAELEDRRAVDRAHAGRPARAVGHAAQLVHRGRRGVEVGQRDRGRAPGEQFVRQPVQRAAVVGQRREGGRVVVRRRSPDADARHHREHAGQPPVVVRRERDELAAAERRVPRRDPPRPHERIRAGAVGERVPVRGRRPCRHRRGARGPHRPTARATRTAGAQAADRCTRRTAGDALARRRRPASRS
jgi:hypothetical protein